MIVLCGGLPRSGSTLQFNIARRLLENSGANFEVLDWMPTERLVEELEKMIGLDSARVYLCKSHKPPAELGRLGTSILLLTTFRDPRDVVASNLNVFGNEAEKTIGDIKSALRCLSSLDAKIHISEYKSLVGSMEDEIVAVANFLGLKVGPGVPRLVSFELDVSSARLTTQASDFGRILRVLERRFRFLFGLSPRYQNRELRLHPNHVSSELGASGYYAKYIDDRVSEKVVNELEESYSMIGIDLRGRIG